MGSEALPDDKMRANLGANPGKAPRPPDLSHPSMRAWLASLPMGQARSAAVETRILWSPGSSAAAIAQELARLGYSPLAKPQYFVVNGAYGPLRAGEEARARIWGAELALALG